MPIFGFMRSSERGRVPILQRRSVIFRGVLSFCTRQKANCSMKAQKSSAAIFQAQDVLFFFLQRMIRNSYLSRPQRDLRELMCVCARVMPPPRGGRPVREDCSMINSHKNIKGMISKNARARLTPGKAGQLRCTPSIRKL